MKIDSGSVVIMVVLIMLAIQHGITWAWVGLIVMLLFLVKSKGLLVLILLVVVVLLLVQLGPNFTEYWWVLMLLMVGVIVFMGKNEPANPYEAYMSGMGGGF
jgi:hypothetical protein